MSLCACGCGEVVRVSPKTDLAFGYIKGTPRTYIHGHNARRTPEDYREEDRGYGTPCWTWARALNTTGYGTVTREGKRRSAHRWFYEQARGPIPEGLSIDHLCCNRACVNPNHMEPVPLRENIWRAHARRLAADAPEIKRLRVEAGMTQAELAAVLGVNQTAISQWERGVMRLPDGRRREIERLIDWSARRDPTGWEQQGEQPQWGRGAA